MTRPHRRHVAPSWTAALVVVLLPSVALAQRLGQAVGDDIPWWRVVAALAFCVALAVAAAVVMRMKGLAQIGGAAPRQLELIASLRLSHQVDVCLVAWSGRQVLIAASPRGVILLGEGAAPKADSPT